MAKAGGCAATQGCNKDARDETAGTATEVEPQGQVNVWGGTRTGNQGGTRKSFAIWGRDGIGKGVQRGN